MTRRIGVAASEIVFPEDAERGIAVGVLVDALIVPLLMDA